MCVAFADITVTIHRVRSIAPEVQSGIIRTMQHRHLNHSDLTLADLTLAAIDDVIARGRLDDWKQLRDAATSDPHVRDRILRVCSTHLADPYAQRYHFWNFCVGKQLA